jgi:23S rRNA pseudouridine2605 synthase
MKRKPGQVSLERALSKRGLASRTQAQALIVAGQVRVNGTVRRDPGFAVNPDRAVFEIEGERQSRELERVTYLLHKPRGVVTTRADERGRPTVFSLLDVPEKLHAVGRLDLATTGLLLLTNDTQLSAWLTEPTNAVPRVYLARVRGEVTEAELARLRQGIASEVGLLQARAARVRKASGRESLVELELTEGKNREVRRMMEAIERPVIDLKRIAFGGLVLGELAPGAYRRVVDAELVRAFGGFYGKKSR